MVQDFRTKALRVSLAPALLMGVIYPTRSWRSNFKQGPQACHSHASAELSKDASPDVDSLPSGFDGLSEGAVFKLPGEYDTLGPRVGAGKNAVIYDVDLVGLEGKHIAKFWPHGAQGESGYHLITYKEYRQFFKDGRQRQDVLRALWFASDPDLPERDGWTINAEGDVPFYVNRERPSIELWPWNFDLDRYFSKQLFEMGRSTFLDMATEGPVTVESNQYFVQIWEKAPGHNLKTLVQGSRNLVRLATKLFASLYFLMAIGWQHSDLHAENVMWDASQGSVKLIDYDRFYKLEDHHHPEQLTSDRSSVAVYFPRLLHQGLAMDQQGEALAPIFEDLDALLHASGLEFLSALPKTLAALSEACVASCAW